MEWFTQLVITFSKSSIVPRNEDSPKYYNDYQLPLRAIVPDPFQLDAKP